MMYYLTPAFWWLVGSFIGMAITNRFDWITIRGSLIGLVVMEVLYFALRRFRRKT